jgi:HK97 gp10 family phage protein
MFKQNLFRIDGLGELKRNAQRADRRLYENTKKTNLATAKRIVRTAKRLVRSVTGNLHDHIDWSQRGSIAYVGISPGPPGTGGVPATVYWRFVEFGTVKAAAHPFFRPAAEAEKGVYPTDVGLAVKDMENF